MLRRRELTVRADPHHARRAGPSWPLGAIASAVLNTRGPLRRRGAGAGRSTTLAIIGRRLLLAPVRWASTRLALGVVAGLGRSTSLVQLPRLRRRFRLLGVVVDLKRPGGAPVLLAHGCRAPSALGRQPDHVPRQHRAGHHARGGRGGRLQRRLHHPRRSPSASSACRWASCSCPRCRGPWPRETCGRSARI